MRNKLHAPLSITSPIEIYAKDRRTYPWYVQITYTNILFLIFINCVYCVSDTLFITALTFACIKQYCATTAVTLKYMKYIPRLPKR